MTSKNTLFPDDIRVGWFLHERSREGALPSAGVLRNQAGRLTLTIPISPSEEDQTTILRWFSGRSTLYADDPDFTRYEYKPPSSLVFADSQGPIGLFNCRDRGYRATLGGAGEGHLDVGFAVLDVGSLDFAEPTHLRTYIPGMGTWVKMSALKLITKRGTDGLNEVTIKATQVEPIELAPGVTLKTNWSYVHQYSDNWLEIQDPPFVETAIPEGVEFAKHLKAHGVFLELVDLAYWQPTGYNRVQCRVTGRDLFEGNQQWYEVQTNYVRHQSEKHKESLHPLFYFQEVGAEGYRKWADLRDKMGKALAPLMTLLDMQDTPLETRFINSCVGLEGIGVQLLRDDKNYNRRSSPPLWKRLERIQEANGFSFSDDWAKRTANLYNDIKHYDRDAITDPMEVWNNLLENQLVFRSWAAIQIGMDKEAVEDRIQYTPAAQQLVGEPGIYFKGYPKK